MTEHVWVEIKYTPVKALVNQKGQIKTYAEQVSQEVAEDEKVLGCWICDLPLNEATINTECNPAN